MQEIHLAISQLVAGNFQYRILQTEDGEDSDSVLLGLNKLAEELDSQQELKEEVSKQIQENEESLRMMFDAMDDDLALIDFKTNRITMCNKQFEEKLLNIDSLFTKSAVQSMDFDLVLERILELCSDSKDKVLEMIADTLDSMKPSSMFLTPDIDGEKKYFELSLHPVQPGEGQRLLWICKNFTEHNNAIEKLQISEQNLNQAEKISHIGHWTLDTKTGEIIWSDELCRIFGVDTDVNPSFEEYIALIHPEDREKITTVISNCKSDLGTFEVRHRLLTANKETRHIKCKGGCVVDESGELIKMLGTSYDISDKEELDEKARVSEARMRETQRMAKMGDWSWHTNDDSGEWSDVIYEIHKLNPEDGPLGLEEYLKMVHPEDTAAFTDYLTVLGNSLKTKEHIFRVYDSEGQVKYIRMIANRRGDDSNIILAGTIQDITTIKIAQERIRESEERLELALNASNTGIFEFIFSEKDLYWDEIAKNIFGYSDEEKESPYDFMLRVSEEGDRVRIKQTFEDMEGVMRRGNYSDSYIITVKGSSRHITTTGVILRDGSGNPKRMVGTIRDITLQVIHDRLIRDMNTQLEKTNRNLKLTNTHLEEIAHVSSHDLMSPLLNLSALFKLINEGTLDQENTLVFEKANQSVQQMKETLNVLSNVLEFQSGKELKYEELNLEEIMYDVMQQISHQIGDSGAIIKVDFTKLPTLRYPRFHLTSILLNLITNAIKYKKIDEVPSITLVTKLESNVPVLEISDNGLGINLDLHRDKLFRLFKRFHDHVPGKGVGLHIVHSVVSSHGGNIEVQSELNKGTTFKLTLSHESKEASENSVG